MSKKAGKNNHLLSYPLIVLASTGSLDKESEENVLNMCEILNENGKTVIIVTHDRNVADRCNKIYKIDNGQCLEIS